MPRSIARYMLLPLIIPGVRRHYAGAFRRLCISPAAPTTDMRQLSCSMTPLWPTQALGQETASGSFLKRVTVFFGSCGRKSFLTRRTPRAGYARRGVTHESRNQFGPKIIKLSKNAPITSRPLGATGKGANRRLHHPLSRQREPGVRRGMEKGSPNPATRSETAGVIVFCHHLTLRSTLQSVLP